MGRRIATFTDLGIDPRSVPGRPPDGLVILEGIEPWDRGRQEAARAQGRCTVHGGGPVRSRYRGYCLECDACSLDGRPGVKYPGLAVGSAADPDYRGEAEGKAGSGSASTTKTVAVVYARDKGLKGGRG